MLSLALVVLFATSVLSAPEPDPEVVGSVVHPVSFGAVYTGIHNVKLGEVEPGKVAYGAPSLVYYGRKKRNAEPDVVGSIAHPVSFGAVYTGIHNVKLGEVEPGKVAYGAPSLVYYGRKKRSAEPDVVGSVTHPVSFGAVYTGIHNVKLGEVEPGKVAYGAPQLVYYGRKKRDAEPDVVGSVVHPISYGAIYTGIHKAEAKLIPGTVTYGNPYWSYYGRK